MAASNALHGLAGVPAGAAASCYDRSGAPIPTACINPDFEPIVLTGSDEAEFQVIAELVEVLGGEV